MPPKHEPINDRYIHRAYLSPDTPGAFSGLSGFVKNRKLKDIKSVQASLSKLPTFSKFKPPKTHYQRVPVIVKQPLELVQIDLMDLRTISKKNRNYSYVLVGICIFTKKVIAIPVKTKSAKDMVPALQLLIKGFNGKITNISGDFGLEFYSKDAQNLFKREGINFYSPFSRLKAQTVSENYYSLQNMSKTLTRSNYFRWNA